MSCITFPPRVVSRVCARTRRLAFLLGAALSAGALVACVTTRNIADASSDLSWLTDYREGVILIPKRPLEVSQRGSDWNPVERSQDGHFESVPLDTDRLVVLKYIVESSLMGGFARIRARCEGGRHDGLVVDLRAVSDHVVLPDDAAALAREQTGSLINVYRIPRDCFDVDSE